MNRKGLIATVVGTLALSVAGGSLLLGQTSASPAPWFDEETGAIDVERMPPRIKIGTDLFKEGYGWLDSANFREPMKDGPFQVFENETTDVPSYWYFKSGGIVPIGSKPTKPDVTIAGELGSD